MGKKYDFEYLVIGSGPAGMTVATELAKHKKHVGLVEGRRLGGANLNTRDVPYAVALSFAHTFRNLLSRPEIRNYDLGFNLPTVAANGAKIITTIGEEDAIELKKSGAKYIKGFANFLDNHTIAVGSKKYTAANFILATGAELKTLGIAGVDDVDYLTPETAIQIRRAPKVVAVVGGGATGCEIAEFYAELGIRTIILEATERLLPKEDEEVSGVLTEYFARKLGMTVLTGAKVVALEQDNLSKTVIFRHANTEKMVRVESVVLATGSTPTIDYGLENTGVKFKNSGVMVDKYFQTAVKNIYAVGDVLGGESSTERAVSEGMTLATNLLNRTKNVLNYKGFVRVTQTYPEVATVGLNEYDLLKRDRGAKKVIVNLSEIAASKLYNCETGFVKLLADKNNRLIGATIVAPDAALIAAELAVAIRHNLTALEIASTPHAVNGLNYAVKLAAKRLAIAKK